LDTRDTTSKLANAVRAGDRRSLARAITLVESRRADHRDQADALLEQLLPHSGKSIRLGVTGVPGVGKSTFIEAFGLHAIAEGHRVAVLAVDPTSSRSGGSLLGDKLRMTELATHEAAYIRPTPTGGTLGGVARRTREALLVCEAAGFDVVIVETVGVGQSETAVADMVDMFLLLLLPGGGDEIQGLKKGIVELADAVIVNKADGELKEAAERAAGEYRNALRLLRPISPNWTVPVRQCSALTDKGIDKLWEMVGDFREKLGPSGEIDAKRAAQAGSWMWSEIADSLMGELRANPGIKAALPGFEAKVRAGELAPSAASRRLLAIFLGK
jgi:LAO/AO transport system kinase